MATKWRQNDDKNGKKWRKKTSNGDKMATKWQKKTEKNTKQT